jgi:glycosyltransferase involved in cell wall biosynthesis
MTEAAPLVFVGIPAYNRPEGLHNTLTALTRQSYTNLQIHISDDASPNQSVLKVMKDFAKTDERIHVYHQNKNLGIIGNHKFLLTQVPEEAAFIMWACDDDDWHPDYIRVCVEALERAPEALVCSTHNLWKDEQENHQPQHDENTHTLGVELAQNRYKQVLAGILWWNHTFYGLIRKSAYDLAALQQHFCFDILFISKLSIEGAFIKLEHRYFTKTIRGYGSTIKSNLASIKVDDWFTYRFPRLKMCFRLTMDIWHSQIGFPGKVRLTAFIFKTVMSRRIYLSPWKKLWWNLSAQLRNLSNFELKNSRGK